MSLMPISNKLEHLFKACDTNKLPKTIPLIFRTVKIKLQVAYEMVYHSQAIVQRIQFTTN